MISNEKIKGIIIMVNTVQPKLQTAKTSKNKYLSFFIQITLKTFSTHKPN